MGAVNIKNFPDDLHHEAKVAAAKDRKPLREWFIEAVKEKLEREKDSK
ncbi:MAG TPA: 3-hydroxyacyl-CoA dehydrogenase [Solidesulfovibrio magneticus]|nr:3-hydroxyacyl-CoA dehydrogenase [Solidesulfovibrio magneticus]